MSQQTEWDMTDEEKQTLMDIRKDELALDILQKSLFKEARRIADKDSKWWDLVVERLGIKGISGKLLASPLTGKISLKPDC